MISGWWLFLIIPVTVIVSICLSCWLVANGYSEQRDENTALKRENATLKAQLKEITALQLKLAAEKAMGEWK